MPPAVTMQSMFMNDSDRNLQARLEHLASKTYPDLSLLWLVGDSDDGTWDVVSEFALGLPNARVVRADTGLVDRDPASRVRRGSLTTAVGFTQVRESDDAWIIHESDLRSPPDIVERFLATGHDVVAGWVTLERHPEEWCFYDTWAYRANGQKFMNNPPYSAAYRADGPFEVDSVGSCWMFPAQALRDGLTCKEMGAVELCGKLKEMGYSIWVDPSIPVVQPADLWISRVHA